MMRKLYYGFLDESGAWESRMFVIAVIIIGNPNEIKNVIKSARQKAKGKFRFHSIFQASKENNGFIKLVLQELVKKNIYIIVNAWSKKIQDTRQNKNEIYAKLLAQIINSALENYPNLSLVIHKRYTFPKIRNKIQQTIIQNLKSGRFLSIEQKTETECKELELADAVAWAVYQKYNNRKIEFYKIIKNKIIKENRLAT